MTIYSLLKHYLDYIKQTHSHLNKVSVDDPNFYK